MIRTALLAAAVLLCGALAPSTATAWWNPDWSSRTRVVIDTGDKGLSLTEMVSGPAIAVRLHSGNFDFAAAKTDGTDIRVIAGDDKTPLPFTVERFDTVNELALLWVRPASVVPGTDKNVFYVYAGNAKAPADATVIAEASASGAASAASLPIFGAPHIVVAHFSEAGGPALNTVNQAPSSGPAQRDANGLLAGSLKLVGEPFGWPAADTTKVAAGSAFTVSMWVKPDAVQQGTLLVWGALKIGLDKGAVVVSAGGPALRGGTLPATAWAHLAVTASSGQVRLFVNGAAAGEAASPLPAIEGAVTLGEGYKGLLDELQIASEARSASAIKLAAASQGADNAFLKTTRETGAEAEGTGSHSYIGVLVGNLTTDAWVVIGILGVMFVIAVWVMVEKSLSVVRIDRGNQAFLTRFRSDGEAVFHSDVAKGAASVHSSLERLHRTGVSELNKRRNGNGKGNGSTAISGASFNAVKAVLDADLVRENHTLNAHMVLLTIAISGGPFLGLLGTVVGVMITFAAIAAAGDVNVNAIAPGIAAALLATVAGLGVAIPALFGYNWLASRIKNISADMQIFVDEFVTRAAESFGQG